MARTMQAFYPARIAAAVLFFVLGSWSLTLAQSGPGVEYSIDLKELPRHVLSVEATYPPQAFATSERVLALPVWTPGSYKVRDYARFVGEVKADHPQARVTKIGKTRWRVEGVPKDQPLTVSYTVYGHELTVRTNYFTPELSLIVGAATFLAPAPLVSDQMPQVNYAVTFPAEAPQLACALPEPESNRFVAQDYDQLVDSPIVMGDLQFHDFPVGGVAHSLVQAGDWRYWDLKKSLADTTKLVKVTQEFWGQVPYPRYLFLNLITDKRGGLEHKDSTVVMAKRFATEKRTDYLAWLGLISHEFFHTWNVKRLRPQTLGPFDYENEVYTPSLWVAEGLTSYYGELLVRRAGLSTRAEYLTSLAGELNELAQTPGREAITLGDASFDAWIRLYQDADNLQNSNVSYYNKGAVVGWLLDTEIRRRSGGKKSLDDVMRRAYREFPDGYTEDEFRQLVNQVGQSDFSDFFRRAVDSTQELDLKPALTYWGLRWEVEKDQKHPTLGVEVSAGPEVVVKTVLAGGPAAKAGLAPGDELLSVDGLRLHGPNPLNVLEQLKADQPYRVLYTRLGRVQTVEVRLAEPLAPKHRLTFGTASAAVEKRWDSWLGPERKTDL